MSPQKRHWETGVDNHNNERNIRPARAPTALSHSALEQHNRAAQVGLRSVQGQEARLIGLFQDDDRFAESITRNEASQLFHQALYNWHRSPGIDTLAASVWDNDEQAQLGLNVETDLTQIVRHHKPAESSNTTPFERYLTVGTVNEPFPLHAKKALSDMAIGYGSLESVRARSGTARLLTNEAMPNIDSGSEGEEDGLLPVRKIRSAPPGYRTKTRGALSLYSSQNVSGKVNGEGAKRTKTG